MTILIGFLQSIPDVVWSALLASVLTLSGVLISNRSNTNRLRLQLEHDATEKAKERTAALRRDVYLRAAEELVRANAHLASLPQLDLSKTNLGDGLQGFFAAAARLQLVAEPRTALLVGKLTGEYGELVLKLMTHLMPVSRARTDIQIADDLYSKAQTQVARILSEMAKHNESGRPDPQIFEALNAAFTFHQSQAVKYSDERSEAWNRFNQDNIMFQKYLLIQLRDISSKHVPIMIEIRRDLGLIGDLAEVEAHMKQQWQRMEAHFDALIAAVKDG